MAIDPTRKNRAVQGILFARPPIRFMSAVPVLTTTDPAPMKRSPLKTAWLSEWYMLASRARAARVCEAVRHEDHREPQAQDDDPDVLDAVVGESALDVVLHGA